MIDVITCILGGYDNLRPPSPPNPDVRYLCYTDEPRIDSGWQLQPIVWSGFSDRQSRVPKILSHLHSDAEYSLWIDGCFCPRRPADFIREHLAEADVAVFQHPRLDAFREAAYCNREGYGNAEAIDRQLDRYRAEGFPGVPFVCGGIIARRENAAVRAFNELWWAEYQSGQERDQFPLSYALWRSGVRVKVIPGDILQNPWISFHFHAAHYDLSDNPQFAAQRKAMEARTAELRRLGA